MLKSYIYVIFFEQVIAIGYVGFVGFNLTLDVHKKPDTFTLLNHYTVIMALAFRIIVYKKKAVPIASKPCL